MSYPGAFKRRPVPGARQIGRWPVTPTQQARLNATVSEFNGGKHEVNPKPASESALGLGESGGQNFEVSAGPGAAKACDRVSGYANAPALASHFEAQRAIREDSGAERNKYRERSGGPILTDRNPSSAMTCASSQFESVGGVESRHAGIPLEAASANRAIKLSVHTEAGFQGSNTEAAPGPTDSFRFEASERVAACSGENTNCAELPSVRSHLSLASFNHATKEQ